MASPKKKQTIDSHYIITNYMNYALEHDSYPKSVFKFCKESKIKEEEFYSFFGSLDSVNKRIWNTFFSTTIDAMNSNEEYDKLSSKDKMLTFFYTFFELLTLNRSYVLFALKYHEMPLKNMGQLKGLRKHIKDFAKELIEVDNDDKMFRIAKNPVAVYSEGAWLQFLFLLKFWMDDESAGFEKTDIAIEKSVNTIFDLFDNTPLSSVLDFGKFLWKEKTMWN
ncbi:TetR/AcrR family transcriptional regulator [Aquimarina sp. BL5]|uniref:TetR family transcriptional regulator C-terminal domain-containing protein n=1 Tax=Aquimarina sp. BL5 TaxID=1714860 RepID=UPI000E4ACC47|nr:TetR family transcriptional regulator C-terminal domain-containing protein [Aquimarina sp. BL5]AXT50815.1 TetR/AcrR family transcriptional regulator [Aquimarina sp. BL5]RKN05864.1 TetR/AcrR family transcriptional regulator [Aquimarina sp. BL5]